MLVNLECSDMNKLMNLLAYLEVCGTAGHSTDVLVNFDGDGNAMLKVSIFDDEKHSAEYEQLKTEIAEGIDGRCERVTIPIERRFNFE